MNKKLFSGIVSLILLFCISQICPASTARHSNSYTSLVPMKNFDSTVPDMEQRDFYYSGESELHLSNSKNQHVCFRMDKNNKVLSYHGRIAFLMYEFWDEKKYYSLVYNDIGPRNILKRLTYYDLHGNLKGSLEFDDVARIEFEIQDLKKLEKAMNRIDEQEGNYDPEDAAEKNIIGILFNSKGKLISSTPISTKDFWEYQHFLGRP